MASLALTGSKIERHLGSFRFAMILVFLVCAISIIDVPVTIIFNAAASVVGIQDVLAVNTDEEVPDPREVKSVSEEVINLIRGQVSVSTSSIGFSGVLFALDVISNAILHHGSTFQIYLPFKITEKQWNYFRGALQKLEIFEHFSGFISVDNGTIPMSNSTKLPLKEHRVKLKVDARLVPLVTLFVSQFSDPERVSFLGHLSGMLAGMIIEPKNWFTSLWRLYWARRFSRAVRQLVSFRHFISSIHLIV